MGEKRLLHQKITEMYIAIILRLKGIPEDADRKNVISLDVNESNVNISLFLKHTDASVKCSKKRHQMMVSLRRMVTGVGF